MQNISDMSRRLSIVYVWSLLVLSFMESSILATFYIFSFFLVFKLCKSSLQILFGPSHIFGQCWYWWLFIVALFGRWILTLAHFSDVFFWPVNCTCQTYTLYHFWAWAMFHLRVFSIDIDKKCKFNHYLLLLVIFHDLRMKQFWSVKYICLVHKLKFLL